MPTDRVGLRAPAMFLCASSLLLACEFGARADGRQVQIPRLAALARDDSQDLVVRNSAGMQLMVAEQNTKPTLRIVLPGRPTSDRSIEVIFPEHVTVRKRGASDTRQLYMWQPGQVGERPAWRRAERSLEYERDLAGDIHLLARATLEEDGVRFLFRFRNRSETTYDLVYAPIDPRLTSDFHDVRLERTYVHHADGFDLLASETPSSSDDAARSMAACPVPRLVSPGRYRRGSSNVATTSSITTSRERSMRRSSPRFPGTVAG